MNTHIYSIYEISKLKENPYVEKCTGSSIIYTEQADRTRLPLENLSNELNLLLERELTLTDGYSSKLIREEVYKLKLQEIENKRMEIKKQIKDIQAKTGPTVATFEQVKNVFLDGNKASARYLVVDDQEKRKMLEKLLSNASIKNKTVAQYQFKSPYQKLANVPKNANIELLCALLNEVRTEIMGISGLPPFEIVRLW